MDYSIYYKGTFKTCADTKDSYMEGYFLCGNSCKFVGIDTYESKYKSKYAVVENVLIIKKSMLEQMCNKETKNINVGLLYGKVIQPLKKEKIRILCTDYIEQECVNFCYKLEGNNLEKYREYVKQKIFPIGKYKVSNRLYDEFTKLDNSLISSLGEKQVYCVISNANFGNQKSIIKDMNGNLNMGVLVDEN